MPDTANSSFYMTVATVIPVLLITLTIQEGSVLKSTEKGIDRLVARTERKIKYISGTNLEHLHQDFDEIYLALEHGRRFDWKDIAASIVYNILWWFTYLVIVLSVLVEARAFVALKDGGVSSLEQTSMLVMVIALVVLTGFGVSGGLIRMIASHVDLHFGYDLREIIRLNRLSRSRGPATKGDTVGDSSGEDRQS